MSTKYGQFSFVGGEISPRLHDRIDLEKYYQSVDILENCIATQHGGATRRAGTRFVAQTKDNNNVRLLRFEFSTIQTYILEFGDLYMRVYKDGVQVNTASTDTITAATAATPVVITATNTRSNGDEVNITGVVGMTELNGRNFKIANVTGTTYELTDLNDVNINGTSYTAYTSGGTATLVFTLVTPFTSAQIPDLQFTQSADTIFVAHSAHAPQRLVRTGDATWVISAQGLDPPPSAEQGLDLATDMGYGANTGTAVAFRTDASVFEPSDVGRFIKAGAGRGTITAESGDTATINILNAFTNNDAAGPGTASISNVSTTVDTTVAHGASAGDYIIITSGGSNKDIRRIESITDTDTFVVDANFTALDAAATWILHTATASGAWTLEGTPNTTCNPNAKGTKQSDVTLTIGADGWRDPADIGKFVKLSNGIVKLHTITSKTVAKGTVLRVLDDSTSVPAGEWTLEAESWTVANGFPESLTLAKQSLVFAANTDRQNAIWGSAKGDFSDFGVGVDDDDSFEFDMASPLVDVIQWIHPIEDIFLGTVGGEFRLHGATNQAITPTSVDIDNEDDRGSAKEQPLRVGSSLVFINRSRNRLIELAFNLDVDSFISGDLNILADHLTDSSTKTIQQIALQKELFPIIWAPINDGTLLALTILRDQNIVGWAREIIGGTFSGGQAEVESVAVIPHWTKPDDVAFLVVKRTIEGVTKKYIEYFDSTLNTDSAVTTTGTDLTSMGGLFHLEGQSVRIVADGGLQPAQVVTTGKITLTDKPDTVEAGLNYDSKIVTLRPELPIGTNRTSLQGVTMRWSEINVMVFETNSMLVNGEQVLFRKLTDIIGTGIPLFTGRKRIQIAGIDENAKLTFEQKDPLPMTLNGYFGLLHIGDDIK